MDKRDYYEILGVQKNASESEIKKSYRKLAKKYHPDTNPGDKKSEQIFKEITEAYNVLSDPEKKKLYDQFGHAAFDGSMGSNPEDFAKNNGGHFWRTGNNNGTRTEYYYSGNGNPEDIFGDLFGHGSPFGSGGFRRTGGFNSSGGFHQTDGFGSSGGFHQTGGFGGAGGFGFDSEPSADIRSELNVSFRDAALGCEKRISFEDKSMGTLSVKIPAGIGEGQSVRLRGKGRQKRDGSFGDLLLKVHILDDPRYERKGRDVYLTEKIPYTTAVLGGEAEFDTLYGKVSCKVPAGTQSGSKLRLKNKGIVSMNQKNSYGDEYVIIQIEVPRHVSQREAELLRQLKVAQSA